MICDNKHQEATTTTRISHTSVASSIRRRRRMNKSRRQQQQHHQHVLLLVLALLLSCTSTTILVTAFTTPTFGLGAILFQPKGLITTSTRGDVNTLLDASEFFVDAFWVGKTGGGAKQLDPFQRKSLSRAQFNEFRGRYAGVNNKGRSEMVVCTLPNGELVGCAGVEMTPIPQGSLESPTNGVRAPLMSNLAVSRKYRRKGIGELLVGEIERVVQYEWGYDTCYLYVEQRNKPAVRMYEKLGYRKQWVDGNAKTLMPTENGLKNEQTKLICMRKKLGRGILGRLLPF